MLTILLHYGPEVLAQEHFVASADVVRSEPIVQSHQRRVLSDQCATKPAQPDLLNLLYWDLGTGPCADVIEEERITGYRVYYRWDDHVFSQLMAQQPGDQIPIRVSVN
jgi:uncharacterized protein YcfJ